KGVADPTAFLKLLFFFQKLRPELVVSWLYHADLMAALGRMGSDWPLLWNLRGSARSSPGSKRIPWIHRLLAHLSRVPAGIIVNSEAGLRYHQSIGYHPVQWHLIPNGIDTEQFRPDLTARSRLRTKLGFSEDI